MGRRAATSSAPGGRGEEMEDSSADTELLRKGEQSLLARKMVTKLDI